jgi:hypothetical protein
VNAVVWRSSEAITADVPAHKEKADCRKGGLAKRSGRSCWKFRARRNLAGKDEWWFVAVVKDFNLKFVDDVAFAGTKGPLARDRAATWQEKSRRASGRARRRAGSLLAVQGELQETHRAGQGMWILVLVRLTHSQEPRQGHFLFDGARPRCCEKRLGAREVHRISDRLDQTLRSMSHCTMTVTVKGTNRRKLVFG